MTYPPSIVCATTWLTIKIIREVVMRYKHVCQSCGGSTITHCTAGKPSIIKQQNKTGQNDQGAMIKAAVLFVDILEIWGSKLEMLVPR